MAQIPRTAVGLIVLATVLAAPLPLVAQAELLTLDQLIARAPDIVVGTVVSRKTEWEHYGSSRLIITKVSIEIEQTLKGSASRTLTVEVMGGTIGEESQRLSHVPEFRVGDRDVLFLNGQPHAVSPIVGADQGRFRVMTESATGIARVLTTGFGPVQSVSQIGVARAPSVASMSSALPLSDFVTIVRDRVRALERRQ